VRGCLPGLCLECAPATAQGWRLSAAGGHGVSVEGTGEGVPREDWGRVCCGCGGGRACGAPLVGRVKSAMPEPPKDKAGTRFPEKGFFRGRKGNVVTRERGREGRFCWGHCTGMRSPGNAQWGATGVGRRRVRKGNVVTGKAFTGAEGLCCSEGGLRLVSIRVPAERFCSRIVLPPPEGGKKGPADQALLLPRPFLQPLRGCGYTSGHHKE